MTEGQYNSSPYGAWEAAGGFPAAGDVGAFRQAAAPGQAGEFNQTGIPPQGLGAADSGSRQTTAKRWAARGGLVALGLLFGYGIHSQGDVTDSPQFRQLQTRSAAVEQDLNSARQELKDLRNEKSTLEQKVKAQKSNSKRVSELSTQISTLTSERDSCKSQLDNAKQASQNSQRSSAVTQTFGGSGTAGDSGASSGAGASGASGASGGSDSSGGSGYGTDRSSGGSAYYPNCKAARAAGAAPLYRGQPGYRPGLDRDNDGVACERR